MVTELNPPTAPSRCQRSTAVLPVACSSFISKETVTRSVDLGTSGNCETLVTSGAMLELVMELAEPGVPWLGVLAPQFWPSLLLRSGLRSSRDLPRPSAKETQCQPAWP